MLRPCSTIGCDRVAKVKGKCQMHYQREYDARKRDERTQASIPAKRNPLYTYGTAIIDGREFVLRKSSNKKHKWITWRIVSRSAQTVFEQETKFFASHPEIARVILTHEWTGINLNDFPEADLNL